MILDLDETLVHACSERDNPQIYLPTVSENGEEGKVSLFYNSRLVSISDHIQPYFYKECLHTILFMYILHLLKHMHKL